MIWAWDMSEPQGPYRTPSFDRVPEKLRSYAPYVLGGLAAVAVVILAWPGLVPVPLEASDVPPSWIDPITSFPPAAPDLPVATPLAPLLAIDGPESLAIVWPEDESVRLRRGEALGIRFNRPMVARTTVGRALESSPIHFTPAVRGVARWVSRAELSFTPEPRVFDGNVESRFTFDPELTSVDGEPVIDELERTVVFDGTPRARAGLSVVPQGSPLELYFDAEVSTAELMREMIVYERGGGVRSLPVSVRARGWESEGEGEDEVRRFVVALALRRDLPPGSQIGVALAPRFSSWSTHDPYVLAYSLEPRPSIVGIDCERPDGGWVSCSYESSPGEIVEIGTELVLHASQMLRPGVDSVRVSPPVPGLRVEIDDTQPEHAAYAVLHADWEADQVYEVRVAGLMTSTGLPLAPLAPLAVRSRGHEPTVELASGLLHFEVDTELEVPLRAIHVEDSRVRIWPVDPADAASELLGLAPRAAEPAAEREEHPGMTVVALQAIAPGARANRWGRGTLRVDAPLGPALYAVEMDHAPAERGAARRFGARVLMSRTDLGISTLGLPDGLMVWVASIGSASPVAAAQVTVYDASGNALSQARTDGEGLAWLRGVSEAALIAAESDGDAAYLRFDARSGVTAGTLEVHGGAGSTAGEERLRAIVRSDRGLYRPGERLHAFGLVRNVRGIDQRPATGIACEVQLVGLGMDVHQVSAAATSSAMGLLDVSFVVPPETPLGDATLLFVHDGVEIGRASVLIAQYREPRFRVDIASPPHVIESDPLVSEVGGTYLFGAPVTEGAVQYSVVRQIGGTFAPALREFTFEPVGISHARATVAEGNEALGAEGTLALTTDTTLVVPTRSVLTLEAEVTDSAGQSAASTRRVVVHPAAVEPGIRIGPELLRWGQELDAEVIAVDQQDTMVEGAALEVRMFREGWHAWWEWRASDEESVEEGAYVTRRASRRELSHRCSLTSASEPVHCTFMPTRPGTYVLEVEARDARGRRALASRRLYVAGPDESPDRDPPGAPLALTPRLSRVEVGEALELAFECPWPEAEALIVVSREGVLHTERRRVVSGGNVVSLVATESFAPNAFVTLTLIRPRTGPPTPNVDLHAPDLRFGGAEILVRRSTAPLSVRIAPIEELRPNEERAIAFEVAGPDGRGTAAELVVWATDEGTLRATDYALGDLSEDVFDRAAPGFSLDDARRHLRSRIEAPIEAEASGDGGGGGGPAMALPERERYEPTPLFVGRVLTDAAGHASVPFVAPERLTEYRFFAVATDAAARVGSDSVTAVVSRDLLVEPALPRFLTEGDEVELSAIVHNRTDSAASVEVSLSLDGADGTVETVAVPARGEAAVRWNIVAPQGESLLVTLSARAQTGVEHRVVRQIGIAPRGRWVRHRALVMGDVGLRTLDVSVPASASSRGSLEAVVAAHPFVGLESLADELDASEWSTGSIDAARVLGLASILRLESGSVSSSDAWRQRRARLTEASARLVARQGRDGGFSNYPGEPSDPVLGSRALRALRAARAVGVELDPEVLEALLSRVDEDVREGRFGGALGPAGIDARIEAIVLLTEAGRGTAGLLDSAYQTREFLDGAALAELWLAFAGRSEQASLFGLAEERSGIGRDASEWLDAGHHRSVHQLAALLRMETEHASLARAHDATQSRRRVIAPLAAELLRALEGADAASRAEGLYALSFVAERFRGPHAVALGLVVDGVELAPERAGDAASHFVLPFASMIGRPAVLVARRGAPDDDDHGPVFLSISALWTVPIGEADEQARGRIVALHRVYETPVGTPIAEGAELHVGDLVRVRLYAYVEATTPDEIMLRDPHLAGLEPIDDALATTPNEALLSVLGCAPEDGTADARAFHALRSEWFVRHRSHRTEATTFYLRALGRGLHEFTYVVRATTAGRFTAPPAQIEALADPGFIARSRAATVLVAR